MGNKSLIERISEALRLIPKIPERPWSSGADSTLRRYPDPDDWHDHVELDANAWPQQVERRYSLVPTTCFNCESACGLLAYIDKETGERVGTVDLPGSTRYGMSSWTHEGKQYIIIQLNDGIAAMALP